MSLADVRCVIPVKKTQKRDRLLRLFTPERIYDRLGQLNYINNAKWDLRSEYPREPNLAELYLALPRNRTYASQFSALLGSVK